jgi:hypothetical protein
LIAPHLGRKGLSFGPDSPFDPDGPIRGNGQKSVKTIATTRLLQIFRDT